MRQGVFLLVSVLLGCSGPAARPDADSPPASPLVSSAALDDTMPVVLATGSEEEGDQPAVLFRCEEGTLRAYLLPGAADEGVTEEQLVPISLDSASSC